MKIKYLIMFLSDPLYVCSSRAAAEEKILALAEEDAWCKFCYWMMNDPLDISEINYADWLLDSSQELWIKSIEEGD